jgi:hypothetical protein
MTICIGALCSGSQEQARQALVVASDRMVTLGQITEFEHETPKIVDISTSVVALMAGDALRASSMVKKSAFPGIGPSRSSKAGACFNNFTSKVYQSTGVNCVRVHVRCD